MEKDKCLEIGSIDHSFDLESLYKAKESQNKDDILEVVNHIIAQPIRQQ